MKTTIVFRTPSPLSGLLSTIAKQMPNTLLTAFHLSLPNVASQVLVCQVVRRFVHTVRVQAQGKLLLFHPQSTGGSTAGNILHGIGVAQSSCGEKIDTNCTLTTSGDSRSGDCTLSEQLGFLHVLAVPPSTSSSRPASSSSSSATRSSHRPLQLQREQLGAQHPRLFRIGLSLVVVFFGLVVEQFRSRANSSRPLLLLRSDIDFACQLVSQRTQFVLFVDCAFEELRLACHVLFRALVLGIGFICQLVFQRTQLLVGFPCQQLSLIRPLFFQLHLEQLAAADIPRVTFDDLQCIFASAGHPPGPHRDAVVRDLIAQTDGRLNATRGRLRYIGIKPEGVQGPIDDLFFVDIPNNRLSIRIYSGDSDPQDGLFFLDFFDTRKGAAENAPPNYHLSVAAPAPFKSPVRSIEELYGVNPPAGHERFAVPEAVTCLSERTDRAPLLYPAVRSSSPSARTHSSVPSMMSGGAGGAKLLRAPQLLHCSPQQLGIIARPSSSCSMFKLLVRSALKLVIQHSSSSSAPRPSSFSFFFFKPRGVFRSPCELFFL
ncbi:hypothetical protein B0H14DRAFT_3707760 [Mycena olivaceomarginata]|nr:hypothetical protein B0H14DRAFT_3707760 [Mycena olivaceomarginata]